jgi:hypothetical protein
MENSVSVSTALSLLTSLWSDYWPCSRSLWRWRRYWHCHLSLVNAVEIFVCGRTSFGCSSPSMLGSYWEKHWCFQIWLKSCITNVQLRPTSSSISCLMGRCRTCLVNLVIFSRPSSRIWGQYFIVMHCCLQPV